MPSPRGPTDYDEVSVQQNILLTDSLEELANLRKQLYSAAEYFELSYINHDQKQTVVNTLKDYAIKALLNTVDHLGSVTYKANDMLEEKVVEVSSIELRISGVEQRLRTCHEYIDREGFSQQSLMINTPKHCKRYILPVGETRCDLDGTNVGRQFQNAAEAKTMDAPRSVAGNGHFPSPSAQVLKQSIPSFSISDTTPKRELEKRTVSPHRFRHLRSASVSSRPDTPKSSRPTTPNPSRPSTPTPTPRSQLDTSELCKSTSLQLHAERENTRDSDRRPSKSKRLLKALLSRRKSKNDDMLYTYLDEY